MARKKVYYGLEGVQMYFLKKMGKNETTRGCKTLSDENVCCCVGFGKTDFEESASLDQIEEAGLLSSSNSDFLNIDEFPDGCNCCTGLDMATILTPEDLLLLAEEENEARKRNIVPFPKKRKKGKKKAFVGGTIAIKDIETRNLRVYVVPEKEKRPHAKNHSQRINQHLSAG